MNYENTRSNVKEFRVLFRVVSWFISGLYLNLISFDSAGM